MLKICLDYVSFELIGDSVEITIIDEEGNHCACQSINRDELITVINMLEVKR